MNSSVFGAALLAMAVVLGAFGAHGLRDRLDAYSLGIWEKAVFYHFIHAAGMLVIPLFARTGALNAKAAGQVNLLLLAGILLFSGSLYALALSGTRALGAVTPLGGVAFIAGWLWLAWQLTRSGS